MLLKPEVYRTIRAAKGCSEEKPAHDEKPNRLPKHLLRELVPHGRTPAETAALLRRNTARRIVKTERTIERAINLLNRLE